MKRRNVLSAIGGAAVVLGTALPGRWCVPKPPCAATYSGYAMAYFTESPSMTAANYGLHLAVSSDGLNWTPLNQNNPVATPTLGSGGLRDPFILRKQDGTFVVLATDLNGTDWSVPEPVPAHLGLDRPADVQQLPAAEGALAGDPRVGAGGVLGRQPRPVRRGLLGGPRADHNVLMVNYTSDFVTATSPRCSSTPATTPSTGTSSPSAASTTCTSRTTPTAPCSGPGPAPSNPGSFSIYTSAITPGRGVEAPQIVKSNTANIWYMWGDTWSPNGRFFCWQTSDVASGSWTLLGDRTYTQPLNSKHLGITPITATELSNLTQQMGHADLAPRQVIQLSGPVHPARQQRGTHRHVPVRSVSGPDVDDGARVWRTRPGSRSGRSTTRTCTCGTPTTRSCSTPTTAPAQFNADATFYPVSGFADSSWTSFRSYNYHGPVHPARQLRAADRRDHQQFRQHRQAGRDLPHRVLRV